jgi:hypothetical protein
MFVVSATRVQMTAQSLKMRHMQRRREYLLTPSWELEILQKKIRVIYVNVILMLTSLPFHLRQQINLQRRLL